MKVLSFSGSDETYLKYVLPALLKGSETNWKEGRGHTMRPAWKESKRLKPIADYITREIVSKITKDAKLVYIEEQNKHLFIKKAMLDKETHEALNKTLGDFYGTE